MKYLKLFENYDDPLYEEISDIEYSEKIGYDLSSGLFNSDFDRYYEDFTPEEDKKIESLLPDRYYTNSSDITTQFETKYDVQAVLDVCKDRPNFNDQNSPYTHTPQWTITKLRDSWYIVYDCNRSKFYKCDEFEGLTSLIKEVLTR